MLCATPDFAVVRGFATWLRTTDPAAERPRAGLIPARVPRATRTSMSATRSPR